MRSVSLLVKNDVLLTNFKVGVLLAIEAVLLLQPTKTADQKYKGAITHSIFNGLGFLLLTIGLIVIIYNKIDHAGTHFESPHAIFGLITYILLFGAASFGTLMFYFPKVFGSEAKAKSTWKFHRAFGYITSFFLLITVILSTYTDHVHNNLNVKSWTIILASVLVVIGVGARVKKQKLGL
jgi:hypothetical protein